MFNKPTQIALACALLCNFSSQALAQKDSELNPVVVSASKYDQSGIDVPAGITVITKKQIEDFGALTVNEAIMKIGGVAGRPSSYGGSEYNLDIGGYGATASSNMVIVLNGIRLTDPDQGETRISGIPIDQVEKIEILYGGNSVLYGESATGGVIHITTRKSATQEPKFNYFLGVGSDNTKDTKANFTYGANGVGLNAYGAYRESDNHRQNFNDRTHHGGVNLDVDRGPIKLGISLREETVDARMPGSITVSAFQENPYQIRSSKINDWARIRDFNSSAYAQVNTSYGLLNLKTGDRRKDLTANSEGYINSYDISGRYTDLNIKNIYSYSSYEATILFGLDYSDWQRVQVGSNADSLARAAYVKSELSNLKTKTKFNFGYRSESINRSSVDARLRNNLSAWELGINQSLVNGITPYSRVAKSYRLPNVDDCFFDPNNNYRCTSLSARPQYSKDYEAGLKYLNPISRINFRYVRSHIEDLIGYNAYDQSNTNLGNAVNNTYQLDGLHILGSKMSISYVLKHMNSEFIDGSFMGKKVPLVPQNSAAFNINYKLKPNHAITYGLNYFDSRSPDGDLINDYSMPSYATSDLRYVYREKNHSYGVSINNLFDKKYYSYGIPSNGQVFVYPERGRTLMFHLRSHF